MAMRRPTEGELVDMQRRARAIIETLRNAEGFAGNLNECGDYRPADLTRVTARIEHCSDLAIKVSDDTDKLADYIRSLWSEKICPSCHEAIPYPMLFCEDCARNAEQIVITGPTLEIS